MLSIKRQKENARGDSPKKRRGSSETYEKGEAIPHTEDVCASAAGKRI